jgi:uncharacterized HAD superfamily protein
MKLAFDLDGVLYPWQRVIYEHYRPEKYKEISYEDFFSGTLTFPAVFDYNLIHEGTSYTVATINPKVVSMIERLSTCFDIYYISCRPRDTRITTEIFLNREQLASRENLYLVDNKVDACRDLSIDIIVEDMKHHIEKLKDYCFVYIMNQPWNRNLSFHNTKRIYNILDLEKEIHEN